MAERVGRGLIDTSVVIDLDELDRDRLPIEVAVSALTMAELAAGPHSADDVGGRRPGGSAATGRGRVRSTAVRRRRGAAYGRVYAAVTTSGSKARGPRAVDLLIAATALANDLPRYTRNADDFRFLDGLLDVVAI